LKKYHFYGILFFMSEQSPSNHEEQARKRLISILDEEFSKPEYQQESNADADTPHIRALIFPIGEVLTMSVVQQRPEGSELSIFAQPQRLNTYDVCIFEGSVEDQVRQTEDGYIFDIKAGNVMLHLLLTENDQQILDSRKRELTMTFDDIIWFIEDTLKNYQ
jgi:hypothetical protein